MRPRFQFSFCRFLAASTTVFVIVTQAQLHAASDSWNVDAAGNWNATGSWLSGTQVPGSTTLDNTDVATFGFTLTADRIVTVDSPRFIGGISFGNTSAFKSTLSGGALNLNNGGVVQTLSGNGNHTDTISSPIKISGVSAAAAAFTANATSATSLLSIGAVTGSATASNTTTLTLNGTNTGANVVSGIIGNGAGGGTLGIAKSDTGSWILSGLNTYTGSTTVTNGTLVSNNLRGLGATTSLLQLNGGTVDLAFGTANDSPLNNTTVGGNATILSNRLAAGAGFSHTMGTLAFTTASTLTANKGANVTSGLQRLQFGNWTVANGCTVDANGGVLLILGSLQTTNPSANFALKSTDGTGSLRTYLTAAGARTGTVTIDTGASGGLVQFGTNNPFGAGSAVELKSGRTNFLNLNSSGNGVGTNNSFTPGYNTTVTGNSSLFLFNGGASVGSVSNLTLGTLSIGANTLTTGNYGGTTATGTMSFGVTTLTGNATFNVANDTGTQTGILTLTLGAVGDGGSGFGLTKSGIGNLVLGATNTYTGTTAVNAGTLLLNGSIAGTATVGTTGTLAGSGTVTGATTIATTGILSPGNNSVGTLNFGSSLTLDSGSTYAVTISGATSNDKVVATGALTANGTIAVTLSGYTPVSGDTFDLADAASISGTPTFNFSAAVLGSGLVWNTSSFATNGTIKVASSASYPTWISGFSFVGGADTTPTGDPDADGISNGAEFVLGGNPATGMDSALLPTIELVTNPIGVPTGDYLLFTYRRSDASVAAGVTAVCETSTSLPGSWTTAVDGTAGVVILTDDNYGSFVPAPAANTDRVRVYVPRAANTKLFGRLRVTVP